MILHNIDSKVIIRNAFGTDAKIVFGGELRSRGGDVLLDCVRGGNSRLTSEVLWRNDTGHLFCELIFINIVKKILNKFACTASPSRPISISQT
jgi:hypothetical protein